MDGLIAFLKARLDEDDRVARNASDGPWVKHVGYISGGPTGATRVTQQAQAWNADHIARHDPARVLREVEAKRQILNEHPTLTAERVCTRCSDYAEPGEVFRAVPGPCATVRLLALPYADHNDYREEWKP
jgi:hypothetical protein